MSNTRLLTLVVVLVAALLLAACQTTTTTDPTPVPGEDGALPQTGEEGTVVQTAQNEELGTYLVDEEGMTLYMFTNDTPDQSNCTGDCLVQWPPYVAEGQVVAGEGVDSNSLGTITRDDGTMQVTYQQMPLYYWINDQAPGDTTGQGVGGVWFVVEP